MFVKSKVALGRACGVSRAVIAVSVNKAEESPLIPLINQAKELDKKLINIEDFFFSMGMTGSGDGLRWPDKFYVRL